MTQKAISDLAKQLQEAKTRQDVKNEEMKVKIIERTRQIELQEQEILRKEKELEAQVKKPAEAQKYKMEILAQAEKERVVLEAEAEAEAIKVKGEAEAYAIEEKAKVTHRPTRHTHSNSLFLGRSGTNAKEGRSVEALPRRSHG